MGLSPFATSFAKATEVKKASEDTYVQENGTKNDREGQDCIHTELGIRVERSVFAKASTDESAGTA